MKKILILIIFATFIIGCKDEQVQPVVSSVANTNLNPEREVIMRAFIVYSPSRYGCYYPGWNCWPDVVVTGQMVPIVNGIFDVVLGGNQSAIRASFITNQAFLSNYMNISDIQKVISGEYSVYGNGTNTSIRYFVLKTTSNNSLQTVYPFN